MTFTPSVRDLRARSRTPRHKVGKKAFTSLTPQTASTSSNSKFSGDHDSTGKSEFSSPEERPSVHFRWKKGMKLRSGMTIVSQLGEGTFGRVLLVENNREKTCAAVKVICNVNRYVDDARVEAKILSEIRHNIKTTNNRLARGVVVGFYGSFVTQSYPSHYCLAFEPLGPSMYSALEKNRFQGFMMKDMQSFASQILGALDFFATLKLTHTDLKPENLLLCRHEVKEVKFPRANKKSEIHPYWRPVEPQIKIVDFGGATYDHMHHSKIISTRQYRAPEVLLEAGWDQSADVFSLGSILIELYTGHLLFRTHETVEHLHLLDIMLGPFSPELLQRSSLSIKEQYLKKGASSCTAPGRDQWRFPLDPDVAEHARSIGIKPHDLILPRHELLGDLVTDMLVLDSRKRPPARELLSHAFFGANFKE
eukprot:GEMP01002036.1.p1 GENE.GEMP01002036.1~~GEMP01002036.1.p1  ORF type:complete len:422 (-),score=74.34 GEMP01002036.1:3491-4756(-)